MRELVSLINILQRERDDIDFRLAAVRRANYVFDSSNGQNYSGFRRQTPKPKSKFRDGRPTLKSMLLKVLNGKKLRTVEARDEVLALGYKTKCKNFIKTVQITLREMNQSKLLRRVKRGVYTAR
jgi:hypothetical protein